MFVFHGGVVQKGKDRSCCGCYSCLCSALTFNFAPATPSPLFPQRVVSCFSFSPLLQSLRASGKEGESDMVSVQSLKSPLISPLLVLLSIFPFVCYEVKFFHRLPQIFALYVCARAHVHICVRFAHHYQEMKWRIRHCSFLCVHENTHNLCEYEI